MKRLRVLITTGVALLVLAVGLTLRDWERAMELAETPEPQGPALIMENVRAQGFNDNGSPEYWLRALAANRYDEPEPHTLLAMPWLELTQGQQRWQINAEQGRVEGENEHIVLRGKVHGRPDSRTAAGTGNRSAALYPLERQGGRARRCSHPP